MFAEEQNPFVSAHGSLTWRVARRLRETRCSVASLLHTCGRL